MTRMTATTSPMTVALKEELFEDRWHRQFFIDEWILSDEPDHAMPWEPGEQRPDLGAILVQVDENINSPWTTQPRIMAEALFIDMNEMGAKRARAVAWAKATATRDICPLVISYRLTDERTDFESLELIPVFSLPEAIGPGVQFSYDGTAYPIPFGRGIALAARGRFELCALSEAEAGECWFINDEAGEYWFRIRNLDNSEELFITRTLLGTATFSPR